MSAFEATSAFHSLETSTVQLDSEMLNRIRQLVAKRLVGHAERNVDTPDAVRRLLEEVGIVPATDQAKRNFWMLGENWWRQILDGKAHKLGKWVFDQGLHGWNAEPGFLESALHACAYATENFDQILTYEGYEEIHAIACRHFKGSENNTLCASSEIRTLRDVREYIISEIHDPSFKRSLKKMQDLRTALNMFDRWAEYADVSLNEDFTMLRNAVYEATRTKDVLCWRYPEDFNDEMDLDNIYKMISTDLLPKVTEEVIREEVLHCAFLNQIFRDFASRFDIDEPLTEAEKGRNPGQIKTAYRECDQNAIRCIVHEMFREAQECLEQAQRDAANDVLSLSSGMMPESVVERVGKIKVSYQEQTLQIVANLYAELMWLHPWIDGQGRASLIQLSALLTREGLHPAILEEPYFCLTNTVEDSTSYLKEGLLAYEQACMEFGVHSEGKIPSVQI